MRHDFARQRGAISRTIDARVLGAVPAGGGSCLLDWQISIKTQRQSYPGAAANNPLLFEDLVHVSCAHCQEHGTALALVDPRGDCEPNVEAAGLEEPKAAFLIHRYRRLSAVLLDLPTRLLLRPLRPRLRRTLRSAIP